MASLTSKFIFDHPLKQWSNGKKEGKKEIKKIKNFEKEKCFLDEIKSIFHNYLKTIIWWKKKIVDTSFRLEADVS